MTKRIVTRAVVFLYLLLWSTDASAQQYHYKLNFSLSAEDFADTIAISVEHGQVYILTINGRTLKFAL